MRRTIPYASVLALVPGVALANTGDGGLAFIALLLVAFGIFVYFLPAIIGAKRQVTASGFLFIINLLFGWSVIGWIVCVLWAVCGQTKAQDAYWQRGNYRY
ncbi:MAG TPA: superinfection immunity protein [Candidatus Binatus sp.]|nr:superinfection immunity protein [Candidatus Binatus sp.]